MNLADPHQRTIDAPGMLETRRFCARGGRKAEREREREREREMNTLSKSRRGEPVPFFHSRTFWLAGLARIGHEQGEINSPVLILTDSATKWLVAWFHQSARVITGVPRFVRSFELERVQPQRDLWPRLAKSRGPLDFATLRLGKMPARGINLLAARMFKKRDSGILFGRAALCVEHGIWRTAPR